MAGFSLFGDLKLINRLARLQNETFTTVFGDMKIDFSRQALEPGDHTVRVFTVFGDVKLRIPETVGISLDGMTIFGETEIENHINGEDEKVGNVYHSENLATAPVRIHLRVSSIFGDTDVIRVASRHSTNDQSSQTRQIGETFSTGEYYEGETRRISR